MEIAIVVALAVFWLSSAGFCAWVADAKGRDGLDWFFLGLLFGLTALIAIAGAPVLARRAERRCQACDESISDRATVCPYCRSEQEIQQSPIAPPVREAEDPVEVGGSVVNNAEGGLSDKGSWRPLIIIWGHSHIRDRCNIMGSAGRLTVHLANSDKRMMRGLLGVQFRLGGRRFLVPGRTSSLSSKPI